MSLQIRLTTELGTIIMIIGLIIFFLGGPILRGLIPAFDEFCKPFDYFFLVIILVVVPVLLGWVFLFG